MGKFEEMIDVLDQQAEILAAVKDQGDKAIESTIDRIAAAINASLSGDDDEVEKVFDVMLNYVVDKSEVYVDN